jgi:hypothetical protein
LTIVPHLGRAAERRERGLHGGNDLLVGHHRCYLTPRFSGGAHVWIHRRPLQPLVNRRHNVLMHQPNRPRSGTACLKPCTVRLMFPKSTMHVAPRPERLMRS